jgi:hypothetical protein
MTSRSECTPELLNDPFIKRQDRLCRERQLPFVPCFGTANIGLAVETKGLLPINGLRHPANGYSGWFIWAGEVLSDSEQFFKPVHALHLEEVFPEVIPFLGLAPGHRFLIAGDRVDIWFDESLLDV